MCIAKAAELLLKGELVAFPTETVYGLGADAENPEAVAKIYQAKGRPQNHPVIVHLPPDADISYWVSHVPEEAKLLIQHFWPGPLTLILPRAKHIPDAVSGGQLSIGLRCPSHPVAQQLLRAFAQLRPNAGVAAPSANKFGQVSPTSAAHVESEFPGEIQHHQLYVVEGGDADIGIESTIVDLSRIAEGIGAVLLRPGHITRQQLADVLGYMPASPDKAAPRVSGTLKAHYAPHTPLQMVQKEDYKDLLTHIHKNEKWVLMGFPQDLLKLQELAISHLSVVSHQNTLSLSDKQSTIDLYPVSDDPTVYAKSIYALLRQLDTKGYQRICVQALPQDLDWEALNDRLQRAAAAFES
ncbi:threonylcarbamoyl-AMP synthase [Pelistega sp. NLN82]|uniref:Threonylcarbamoyl-AMP synthase n=1 Tax=Pelistega ratti TaxID=2652177 RepID=A0A6L9Y311_9BURK|nr:L-threonylcarbamoyladenylate synthase [Pelistega ratti]NEN74740.1 threonylcarbamoyl-AMP synthase [Pelistega ratti]